MPIKQEKMNRITLLAFKKLQCAILLEHFHQQNLKYYSPRQTENDSQCFFLFNNLNSCYSIMPSRDNWNYINGDKYSRTFIIARTNIDPAAALSLTSPQLIFLLYPYINDYDIDLKIKAHLQSEIRCSRATEAKTLCRGDRRKNGSQASSFPIIVKKIS